MPALLMEAKVAVTPMEGFTRFAGTMELSGINHSIRKNRVAAIAKAAQSYYTDLSFEAHELENAGCGLRPVSPDGMPYIGRLGNWQNVCVGAGHAMMGWSLGPITGKLIQEIISGKKTSINLESYHPLRKFK
jgi:D-amino-acid dehydrogenase